MPTCSSARSRRTRWTIRGICLFALPIGTMIAKCGCMTVDLNSNESKGDSSLPTNPETRELNPNMMHFELRPTAFLIEERRRQRRRNRRLYIEHDNKNVSFAKDEEREDGLPPEWFHPQSRAVYATLHHLFDKSDENDEDLAKDHYRDFVKYRHLSRFERHFREQMGLNLHPNWSGNYSNATERFVELHDSSILWKEILGGRQSRTKYSHVNGTDSHSNRRNLLEALVGGKFDQYQAVPLSQGYGTHYVHLWVGSPVPQRQSVIVDTGSHFTGFPVARECTNCGESHHTDPHFDPERSETFQALRCPSECLENYECEFEETGVARAEKKNAYLHHHRNFPRCSFSQAYTEGSSWTAYQASDLVYCGGGADLIEAADPLDIQYSLRFVFGCLKSNTGLFVTQLADGIMGMSAHELTLPKQLYNKRKIEYNMFAMCFRKELGTSKKGVTAGSMTLGGVSSALDTSPMVYARNIRNYGWYTVYVEKIFLANKGGTKFLFDDKHQSLASILQENSIVPLMGFDPAKVNRDRGVIVDSGTTDTYLCSSIRKEFSKAWKEATGTEYSNSAIYLTQSQLEKLPTLLVQLQASGTMAEKTPVSNFSDGSLRNSKPVMGQVGYLDPDHPGDVLLSIPATSYMEYSPTLKVYTSRLFFTESRGGVIGANAMQGHNVLFDWQYGRIGFAQSSCSYDLIAGKNDNHGDFGGSGRGGSSTADSEDVCVFFDDGRLPILSQSCLQSVSDNPISMAICKASDSPTNVEVEGTEIWTLRVETSGNDPSSCEDAIREWSDSKDTQNQIESSTTECTHDGLCHEYRPCHVPCLAAIEYHEKKSQGSDTLSLDEAVTIPHPFVNRTATSGDMTNSCKDWIWTGCDHSCRQSRISSSSIVTHTTGSYCLELESESRSCHIDSCGRSDPCIVPFLVHAIFVLEKLQENFTNNGSSEELLSYWTPQVQEDFRKRLVLAAHHPDVYESRDIQKRKGALFGEGDIDILVANPWYDEHEENTDYSKAGNVTTSQRIDDEDDENLSKGIQLILQISISNPRAIPKENKETGDSRSLLQEVGVVWSNFSSVFRRSETTSVCDPFDLYPLAKSANLVADEILGNPKFLSLLANMNKSISDEIQISHSTENINFNMFHSARLVSSWTIGTQIYDDSVNYLGPLVSTSLYPLIKALHQTFYFISFLWALKLLTLLYKNIRLCRVCGIRLRKKWFPNRRHQNDSLEEERGSTNCIDKNNNRDHTGMIQPSSDGVGASSEIELAATYRGSKATKRAKSSVITAAHG